MSYNHQEFPKIQINQKILQLTEKDGFGIQQISSLKTKLTPIQHIQDKNHKCKGPWQSGGWDSTVCDFSFSRLRVETQSLIRELGTNMPCGMAKKKKKKKAHM